MAGIGIAVEELDGALRALHEGSVDLLVDEYGAHRDAAVGQPLGAGQQVRDDAPALRGEGFADAAETGDHFVEDQQDAMLAGYLAQPLKVALGRQHHAGRAGHRLDDHRGDILGAVQGHQAFQLLGLFHAMLGQADGEGVAGDVQGVRQVVDPRQQVGGEGLAVVDHTAYRQAAEADPVVAQFAADQAGAGALADGALVGKGDLQRGVRRFRAGVGEEHFVQARRGDFRQPRGEFERQRVTHLERRGVVEGGDLPGHRFADLAPAVAGIAAPEAGGAVEDAAPALGDIVDAFGAFQQARPRLELAVGGEGHPEVVEAARLRLVIHCHRATQVAREG